MPFPLNARDLGVILLATCAFFILRSRRRAKYPLPPSPSGWLPILGHTLQIPASHGWTTFERWGRDLNSDMIYVDAAGQDPIVVNSFQIAKDLFDTRGAIYSGRSSFTMLNELMGFDWTMPSLQYNAKWKAQRRMFAKFFSASNPKAYQPAIKEYVVGLLPKLLDSPEDYEGHIKQMVGATVISLAYGIRVLPRDDSNLKIAQDTLDAVLHSLVPGRYLVDTISVLKYLPEWMPGTGFLQDAKRGREMMVQLLESPFADAQRHIANGSAKPSLTSMVLDAVKEMDDPQEVKHTIQRCKEVASVFFGAGYDTTHATIINFILCMTCFPDVQAKAQREIDQVVGSDRLPAFEDELNLPYLRAVLKEVVRWRPVSWIGLPHLSAEDDVYYGYFIPKNTLIMPNQRGMMFDPEMYPDPYSFKPEHFLSADGLTHNPKVRDPQEIGFGFGRRMCPGFHIALSELFLSAASILATFEISKAKDAEGITVEPSLDVSPGLTSHPLPFRCGIKPRCQKAEALIHSHALEYDG